MAFFSRLLSATLFSVTMAAGAGAETIVEGYDWQKLADGIYLHRQISATEGPVDGNSIVIFNPKDVIVIDTHINPAVTRAVIGKIKKMTKAPVRIVINTHWHDDHTNGNQAYRQAFPNVTILSHQATIDALQREWQPMIDQRRENYDDYSVEDILAAANQSQEEDPERAWNLRVYAGYVAALAPELPSLQPVYPDQAAEDDQTFRRKDRQIILKWLGRGNTDGDLVVWIPEDQILITGDLLVSPIPFAFDVPVEDWIATLSKLSNHNAKIIVPGHGPIQRNQDYLQQVRSLLDATVKRVVNAKDMNATFEELEMFVDLSDYEEKFTGGDELLGYAWRSYYLRPALKSTWVTLGYPLPEEE